MLVMILEKAPRSLRGELSRWLMEIKPGVFLGGPSQRVREELWMKACKRIGDGSVLQVWTARNEQGFGFREHGISPRFLTDFDGIALVTTMRKMKTSS